MIYKHVMTATTYATSTLCAKRVDQFTNEFHHIRLRRDRILPSGCLFCQSGHTSVRTRYPCFAFPTISRRKWIPYGGGLETRRLLKWTSLRTSGCTACSNSRWNEVSQKSRAPAGAPETHRLRRQKQRNQPKRHHSFHISVHLTEEGRKPYVNGTGTMGLSHGIGTFSTPALMSDLGSQAIILMRWSCPPTDVRVVNGT